MGDTQGFGRGVGLEGAETKVGRQTVSDDGRWKGRAAKIGGPVQINKQGQ